MEERRRPSSLGSAATRNRKQDQLIEIVTFTGVDERTEFEQLRSIARQYPFCEFGVLLGSRTGNEPRYPHRGIVHAWCEYAIEHGIDAALHLCGVHARRIAVCEEWPETDALAKRFTRVQINLKPSTRKTHGPAAAAFAKHLQRPVILQHDGAWNKRRHVNHNHVEYLLDRSAGRGLFTPQSWPQPPEDDHRVGYAGGISPETINATLERCARFERGRIWLDMESGIRRDDWLDIDKVGAVCEAVQRSGLLSTKSVQQKPCDHGTTRPTTATPTRSA